MFSYEYAVRINMTLEEAEHYIATMPLGINNLSHIHAVTETRCALTRWAENVIQLPVLGVLSVERQTLTEQAPFLLRHIDECMRGKMDRDQWWTPERIAHTVQQYPARNGIEYHRENFDCVVTHSFLHNIAVFEGGCIPLECQCPGDYLDGRLCASTGIPKVTTFGEHVDFDHPASADAFLSAVVSRSVVYL